MLVVDKETRGETRVWRRYTGPYKEARDQRTFDSGANGEVAKALLKRIKKFLATEPRRTKTLSP